MSQSVNVLRYSALIFGVFYGLSHQASITAQNKAAQEHHDWQNKENLISKAKEEFKNKKNSSILGSLTGGGVITDPENPKFDLEKYINSVAGQK